MAGCPWLWLWVFAGVVCEAVTLRGHRGDGEPNHVSLGGLRTAVVFVTYRPTESMLKRMSDASCALAPMHIDVWVLADTTHNPPEEPVSDAIARHPTCDNLRTFRTNETGVLAMYPKLSSYMADRVTHGYPGAYSLLSNHREMHLLHWRSLGPDADYDYYWVIEDDVGFSDIARFMRCQAAESVDLLRSSVPHKELDSEEDRRQVFPTGRGFTKIPSDWGHRNKRSPEFLSLFPAEDFWPDMAYEFVQRSSRKALAVAHGMYSRGEIANGEMMLPTICAYRDSLPEPMRLRCAVINTSFRGASADWYTNVSNETWQGVIGADASELPTYWHTLKF